MTRSFTEINQAIAWQLKESIGDDRFDMWFGSPNAIQVVDGSVTIATDDDLSLSFVRQQFGVAIRESVVAVLGANSKVQFVVSAKAPTPPTQASLFSKDELKQAGLSAEPKSRTSRQRIRRPLPNEPQPVVAQDAKQSPRLTLDRFQFGKNNLLLETAIREVFAEPGKFNPLVIHGPTGCGKTHLATGIITEARKTRRFRRCVNVSAEQFTTSFIDALQQRKLTDFRSRFRNLDLFAIDDIQFLAGKQATVIEFQNTLEALLRSGKQIIVTSDRPVGELPFANESLFTRLSSGLTCPIRYPELSGRLAIVRDLAAQKGLILEPAVESAVAQRIGRDVRLLSGAINRLKAAAMVTDGPMDLELANEYLADLFHAQSPLVSLARIEKAICEVCGVDQAELKSKKRIKRVSTARMLAMWLSRKYTSAGLAEIGSYYGGRSHSTVVAAEKKINGMLKVDEAVELRMRQMNISSAIGRLKSSLDVG